MTSLHLLNSTGCVRTLEVLNGQDSDQWFKVLDSNRVELKK